MASAAGIILATGIMTLGNELLQAKSTPDPKAPVASEVNFRVIPATAIAAGVFYMLEQASEPIAKSLAWIVFFTAFAFPAQPFGGPGYLTPLNMLINMTQ